MNQSNNSSLNTQAATAFYQFLKKFFGLLYSHPNFLSFSSTVFLNKQTPMFFYKMKNVQHFEYFYSKFYCCSYVILCPFFRRHQHCCIAYQYYPSQVSQLQVKNVIHRYFTERLLAVFFSWPPHFHTVHCNENPIYVFLRPNFYFHLSVSYLYIPRICPHIFLQQNRQTDLGNI